MIRFNSILLVVLFSFCQANALKEESCPKAYSTCNPGKSGFINVHLIPHTHDDVGWLKTVDQYYYGSNNGEQTASVQYILDTVVQELAQDPNKRFVYVEMAYFWRWWNEQKNSTKELVRTLISQHRLEFVIGAWCMNDEATTYYQDMIDQQALGFKFILQEFGPCARPRSTWQIDPFGHSREQASLFAQFGFDGLFLGRTDYQDFEHRGNTKTREMVWHASQSLSGTQAEIFTGVLPNGYNPPGGFCFDAYCGDDPIMDNPELEDYNVDKKVNDFLNEVHQQADVYKTNNLVMTLGSDFQYSNAHMWFKNLDKLIFYVNQQQQKTGSRVNIFYSTTACYLYSLNQANTTWTVKNDDFFPYAHRPHSFWTGYFTSRAALKDFVRRTNNYLQSIRQLAVLAQLNSTVTKPGLDILERAMGVAQHHDAVSGTERQHVANDYSKRLSGGITATQNIIAQAYQAILSKQLKLNSEVLPNVFYCTLLNITECVPIEGQNSFTIIMYNPLAQQVSSWIRVPTTTNDYVLTDAETDESVLVDFVEVYPEVRGIPERASQANYNMVFKAQMNALGFKVYSVYKQSSLEYSEQKASREIRDDEEVKIKRRKQNKLASERIGDTISIHNEHLQLTFSMAGDLMEIYNLDGEQFQARLNQQMCIYQSMKGNNSEPEFQASGAYIFRPSSNTPNCLTVRNFTIFNGQQFTEMHQTYNDWITQTIRLYRDARNVELEWQVGPIDISDNEGKEIVTRFQTDLATSGTYYTDSNGREMLERVRDFRPSWPNFNQTESVAGNYYPINSRIFIRDKSKATQLTIVTDRSQGGGSISDGSLEIMVHRRILNDDSLGVSEPLNELGSDKNGLIIKGLSYLLFDTIARSSQLHRQLAHEVNTRPLITFSTNPSNVKRNEMKRAQATFKALASLKTLLNKELPANLHLLTLAPDSYNQTINAQRAAANSSFILRLEHFYELNEDPVLSQPVTIDLQHYFNGTFNLVGIEELSLGANMKVEELNERLKWTKESNQGQTLNARRVPIKRKSRSVRSTSPFEFNFEPMQIRTFRLWYMSK